MKTLILLFFSLISSISLIKNISSAPPYEAIEKKHPLLWKTEMGRASFRTNVISTPTSLIMGSNGNQFIDWGVVDERSGLYMINPSNGKIRSALNFQKWGDFDVNGAVMINNKILFGNDNEELFCVDFSGNILWRKMVSGDIEAEPVLLDMNRKKVVVYATELGEVSAVNPETGATIWSYFTPDFSGWRKSNNRNIFKIKAFMSNTKSFFTRPALADVNSDGVQDLVYSSYNDVVYCISGSNGKLLWTLDDDATDFSLLVDARSINGTTEFWVSSYIYNSTSSNYSLNISRISNQGKEVGKIFLQHDDEFSLSLNSFQIGKQKYLYVTCDSLFEVENNRVIRTLHIGENYVRKDSWNNNEDLSVRNYPDQLFGTKIFKYNNQESCIALLSQFDRANYTQGFVTIISLKDWKVLGRYAIPASSELPPQISDFNHDGKDEILINCSDGFTYCYQVK
jgi:outer membrane protein assembly factor BamB